LNYGREERGRNSGVLQIGYFNKDRTHYTQYPEVFYYLFARLTYLINRAKTGLPFSLMTQSSPQIDCSAKQTLHPLEKVVEHLTRSANTIGSSKDTPLNKALNCTLAEDIYSTINVPPSNNSAVDGYALRLSDWVEGDALNVSQRIPAGSLTTPLAENTVARIFTGASIPLGADCVVMQENVEVRDDGLIVIHSKPSLQDNIRPLGQDIKEGEILLTKGQSLSPQRLGLIASIGKSHVQTISPPRVAILSTGDELIEPGQPSAIGKIYNSNRYLLQGLLRSLGMEVIDLGVIEDKLEATVDALKRASSSADVIITTGGASVGEEDYIQSAIKQLGSIDYWRVAIKPGKPFMFGQVGNTPVLGLPGNPGAVFVTFLMLARPFLLRMQGCEDVAAVPYSLPIGFNIANAGKRREFLRVRIDGQGVLQRHPNQSSGMLSSTSWAEGFAVIREHTQPRIGDMIEYIPFTSLLSKPLD
jgi:molybdopterin molybdotransferase